MRNVPFWIDSAPIKRFPRLERNLNVDVVVIGAGITGITAAHLLKEAGLTVALIERERVASMDTGHTTAHLTCVTDVELQELARNFGDDHAQAAWDAGAAAIDEIQKIVQDQQIECEFTRVPAHVHVCGDSVSRKEISRLKKETSLAEKLGFDATYLESVPYFNLPGVQYPNQAKFHPRKYFVRCLEKFMAPAHTFSKKARRASSMRKNAASRPIAIGSISIV
jgi:glycine/D-amino acid oxidase-like deaminating enzyme